MVSSPTGGYRIARLGLVVVGLHAVGWTAVFAFSGPSRPTLLGFAGLAYALGLRHAFDVDHIAAIDNATRRLMQRDRPPFGAGLFFSLGHSTVVLLLTIAVAYATGRTTAVFPRLQVIGHYVGTTVSGLFLWAIGLMNVVIALGAFRALRRTLRQTVSPEDDAAAAAPPGILMRVFGRLFALVTRPRDLYVVGFLFGLGFDTATEIGLLTAAAVATSQAQPLIAVLALPVVFAAGMSLMDTADGVMMCRAYGWALAHPARRAYYNVAVTGLSVAVALLVGTVQLVSLLPASATLLPASTSLEQLWKPQTLGFGVVALFALSWAVSAATWKLGRFEQRC